MKYRPITNLEKSNMMAHWKLNFDFFLSKANDITRNVLLDFVVGRNYIDSFAERKSAKDQNYQSFIESVLSANDMGEDPNEIRFLRKRKVNSPPKTIQSLASSIQNQESSEFSNEISSLSNKLNKLKAKILTN